MALSSLVAILLVQASNAAAPPPGPECRAQYAGTLTLQPTDDGRTMILAQPYAFIDENCETWAVPSGSEVDGASIPRAAWSLIGPWEGKYRNASVIHDYFCDRRIKPWHSVHLMFYKAMLASGVSPSLARMMYAAVYYGGPRWSNAAIRNNLLAGGSMHRITPEFRALLVRTIQEIRHPPTRQPQSNGARGLMQLMPGRNSWDQVYDFAGGQSNAARAKPTFDYEVLNAVVDQAGQEDVSLEQIEAIADSARADMASGELLRAVQESEQNREQQRDQYLCLLKAYGEQASSADRKLDDQVAAAKCGP
ncbi:DUF1353 domain-containing protein [Sphingomonas sp. M6A6_1c]